MLRNPPARQKAKGGFAMNRNVQTIFRLYENFQKGNIAAVLEETADEVVWEHWDDTTNAGQAAGVPWLLRRSGRQGVAEFFALVSQFQFHEFRVTDILGSESNVAGMVTVDITLPSGRRFRDQEIHLFTFNAEGKIINMRHYADTATHIEAARAMAASGD
jgi:uncharacterized protein